MQTQFDQMLAAVRRAETVDDSVLVFISSVAEQFIGLRAQLASRGDSTAELDLAIANLNQKSDAVLAAIKANTSIEGESATEVKAKPIPPAIVDPNTIAPTPASLNPVKDSPVIVDPNTLPLSDVVARATEPLGQALSSGQVPNIKSIVTPSGTFPTLAEFVAAGYPKENYEILRAQFLSGQHDAAPKPPQDGAGMPVLDVAPVGHTSDELNARGAVPSHNQPGTTEPKSPDELAAEHAADPAFDQH